MTLEEAIHYAEEVVTWSKDYKRLRELETQPCEQQPCTDAISRSEAIRVASGYCHYTNIPDELAKLPSVTPKHCEDAISRQAVDDAIYEYSRSCDVNYAQIMEYIDKLPSVSTEKTAIDCSDSICRADAIKLVKSYIHEIITESGVDKNSHTNKILTDIVESLAFELSPVSVAEKTGRWIILDDCEKFIAKCSKCGRIEDSRMISKYPYCHCGAKMQEETETCKDCTNKCIMYEPNMKGCKDKMREVSGSE